jgi:methionyl aminopeptidase
VSAFGEMAISLKIGSEADGMRAAGKAAASVLSGLCKRVVPGVSTAEIDCLAADLIRLNGATSAFLGYRGFPGNVCISLNDEVIHGIGGPRVLVMGDLVKIDVGVKKGGWIGDTAASVSAGPATDLSSRLVLAGEAALAEGIRFAKAGCHVGDISCAIEAEVLRHGFSVVRDFVGHGVGRNLHEDPQVPNFRTKGKGEKLRAGMTLAIEPMVNAGGFGVKMLKDGWTVVTQDGSLSAHVEHTVLVTDGEPEILTWRGTM